MADYAYLSTTSGVIGGSLIGFAAASSLLLINGFLGASPVLMRALFVSPHQTFQDKTQSWKLLLLSSFLITSTFLLGPRFLIDSRSQHDLSIPNPSPFAYALARLFVGFGTTLGNGCTSGKLLTLKGLKAALFVSR